MRGPAKAGHCTRNESCRLTSERDASYTGGAERPQIKGLGGLMTNRAGCLLGFVLMAIPAYAHHSFGTFDLNRKVEIVGTIAGLDFVNLTPGCA